MTDIRSDAWNVFNCISLRSLLANFSRFFSTFFCTYMMCLPNSTPKRCSVCSSRLTTCWTTLGDEIRFIAFLTRNECFGKRDIPDDDVLHVPSPLWVFWSLSLDRGSALAFYRLRCFRHSGPSQFVFIFIHPSVFADFAIKPMLGLFLGIPGRPFQFQGCSFFYPPFSSHRNYPLR